MGALFATEDSHLLFFPEVFVPKFLFHGKYNK